MLYTYHSVSLPLGYVIKGPPPHTRRSPEARGQVEKIQEPGQRKGPPSDAPQGCPGVPSAPRARGTSSTSLQLKGSLEHLVTAGGYEMPRDCGTHYEMLGRAFWNCTRLIMGWLKEDPKVGKWRDEGDLGRNEQEN